MSEHPHHPSDARPASVDLAVKLLWAAIALSLLGTAVSFTTGDRLAGELSGAGLAAEQAEALAGLAVILGVVMVLLVNGLFVLLTVFIGRGANWARIASTVLAGIGVLLSIPSLLALVSGASVLPTAISLLATALAVVALVLTYRPEANAWFSAR